MSVTAAAKAGNSEAPFPSSSSSSDSDIPWTDLMSSRPDALLSKVDRNAVLFAAGAVAGAIGKTVTAPFDRLKLLMQVRIYQGPRALAHLNHDLCFSFLLLSVIFPSVSVSCAFLQISPWEIRGLKTHFFFSILNPPHDPRRRAASRPAYWLRPRGRAAYWARSSRSGSRRA